MKFLCDAHYYVWDDPHLFKLGADNLLRRYITKEESKSILLHCHNSPYGGHCSGNWTAMKVLHSRFFWPSIFKDIPEHVHQFDKCQRTGGISKRHEMSLHNILKVEVFYCWGIDFVGPLPSSHSNFGPVEYVSKHVEVVATKKNDDKTVIMFLNKNICSYFGVPRGLINDGGSHFCKCTTTKGLRHYNVRHKVDSPYHP